jgi:hypothetical protein
MFNVGNDGIITTEIPATTGTATITLTAAEKNQSPRITEIRLCK